MGTPLSRREMLPRESFSDGRYPAERRLVMAIYYLPEPGTFSEMHQLRSDEFFHHYLGRAVEMPQLHADGSSTVHGIGPDLHRGDRPLLLVRQRPGHPLRYDGERCRAWAIPSLFSCWH